MTKMIKMSLIAAVAVTGMTSTVCAQPLEEAIKGVDVSGMLRYRYDDAKTDSTTNTSDNSVQNNNYRLDVNIKSKVNDVVTANVTVGLLTNNGNGANLGTVADGNDATETAAGLNVRNANFTAGLGFATVIAGKQSIPGPFVDNTSDDISRGTGVVALIPAGPVTIAAGHFVTHNVATSLALATNYLAEKDANELAVLGSVAGVNFDVWYASVTDSLTAMSYGVKASVAGINIDARHSTLDMKDAYSALAVVANGEASLTKVVASTKVGGASVVAGLAVTGKHNGVQLNRVAIDGDNDAQSDFRVWQASAGAFADATAILVGANMEVMPSVTAGVKYVTLGATEGDAVGAKDISASELLFDLGYAMSKNFTVSAKYSMLSVDYDSATADKDVTKGRLELKYTF